MLKYSLLPREDELHSDTIDKAGKFDQEVWVIILWERKRATTETKNLPEVGVEDMGVQRRMGWREKGIL